MVHLDSAGERDVGRVRLGRESPGQRDRVLHAKGDVGDRHLRGLQDLARHLRALAPEGGDQYLKLRVAHELCQLPGQQDPDFLDRLARHRDHAHVGKEDVAIRRDGIATRLRRAELAGRQCQLGMVPDDHREHVVRRDSIFVAGGRGGIVAALFLRRPRVRL